MKHRLALQPLWIAGLITLVLVLWLGSGQIGPLAVEKPTASADNAAPAAATQPVTVRVRTSHARPVTRNVVLSARTAPKRAVDLRARTAGRVTAVPIAKGATVGEGDILVRLALDDRGHRLAQAKAAVAQRKLNYEARQKLSRKGLQAKTTLAEAKTELEAARTQLKQIRLEIGQTRIQAPFDGVLETRPAEVGDYVSVGDTVARLVQQDPFIVHGSATEQDVDHIHTGQPGVAILASGEHLKGQVSYVATEADSDTRTFRVELEVANPAKRLISGASATLKLPVQQYQAHRVSAALLSLNPAGELGIKSVGADDQVQFHTARIIKTEGDDLWLAGLPARLTLITVGQGFVRAGDPVQAVVAKRGGARDTLADTRS